MSSSAKAWIAEGIELATPTLFTQEPTTTPHAYAAQLRNDKPVVVGARSGSAHRANRHRPANGSVRDSLGLGILVKLGDYGRMGIANIFVVEPASGNQYLYSKGCFVQMCAPVMPGRCRIDFFQDQDGESYRPSTSISALKSNITVKLRK